MTGESRIDFAQNCLCTKVYGKLVYIMKVINLEVCDCLSTFILIYPTISLSIVEQSTSMYARIRQEENVQWNLNFAISLIKCCSSLEFYKSFNDSTFMLEIQKTKFADI